MNELGKKLKTLRESKGITQQSLADELYVSRQTISRYECGERYPDLLMLKKLSKVLDISIDELLDDDEMEEVVEKTPVVSNPAINNIMIALYACIVLLFIIQAINVLRSFQPIDELIGGHFFSAFLAICLLVEAVLFIVCFINMIKGTDTPKKTGLVICIFYFVELITRINTIFNRTYLMTTVFAIMCLIPYILGMIGSYMFFISGNKKKTGKILIYIASMFHIFVILLNIWSLLANAPSFVTIGYMLSAILKLLICIAFIYDTWSLEKRREIANSIKQKDII